MSTKPLVPLPYEQFLKIGSRKVYRETPEILAGTQLFKVPYSIIKPRLFFNIRTDKNPGLQLESLLELANYIAAGGDIPALEGDLSPDGKVFTLTDGERRWRAIGLAMEISLELKLKLSLVEVRPNPSDMTEKDRLFKMLATDNRVSYLKHEIAEGILRAKNSFGLTNKEISLKMGKSRQWVDNMVTFAGLPEDVKKEVVDRSKTMTSAVDDTRQHKILVKHTDTKLDGSFSEEGDIDGEKVLYIPLKENESDFTNGIMPKTITPTTKDRSIGGGSGNDFMSDVDITSKSEQQKLLVNISKTTVKIEGLGNGLNGEAQVDLDNYLRWIRNDISALDEYFTKHSNKQV